MHIGRNIGRWVSCRFCRNLLHMKPQKRGTNMQTLGNFNTHFGRELPTERYLDAILELARKNEDYVYTCYLGLVIHVLEEVLGLLDGIDDEGDMESQVSEICDVTGLHLARRMVIHCVALEKLIRLFTTHRHVDDDNQRIFDSFDTLVVVPGPTAVTRKQSVVANLMSYLNDAKFEISHLIKRKIVLTESIKEYCLSHLKKALHVGRGITSDDASMAIRNLPTEVIYKAFSLQFGVDIGAENVDTLDHLKRFVESNGRKVHDAYWRPKGHTRGSCYVEAFASMDAFTGGLLPTPFEKMLQVVWYATHGVGEDSDVCVRFLHQVPHPLPGVAKGPDATVMALKTSLDGYDQWVGENPTLNARVVGVDFPGPEGDAVDGATMKEFYNALHNRVFIDRDDLLIVHVTMGRLRPSFDDLLTMNRWLKRWVAIKAPLERLHNEVGNEILMNYGRIKRLALNIDETHLVRFCYSGLAIRVAEKDPAFAPPFIALEDEGFQALKVRRDAILECVVSAYLKSIFNHTNAKLRLGNLSHMGAEVLELLAGSEKVCIDILPGWNIRETIQHLNITPRQLSIAKELLFVQSGIEAKKSAKKSINDLSVIEKAVEIHTRETGGTESARRVILSHSPMGAIVATIPSQFVLGDGGAGTEGIGIVKEYQLFNDLVGLPTLVDENTAKYTGFALSTRFKQGTVTPESPPVAIGMGAPEQETREKGPEIPVEPERTMGRDASEERVDGDLLLNHLFEDDF